MAWENIIQISTFVTSGCAEIAIGVTLLSLKEDTAEIERKIVECLMFLGAPTALWSDWVLAGLADNLIGVPSSDNAVLYFGYFAAKRLPFFFRFEGLVTIISVFR
jgi:hypothetical protein